MKRPLLIVASKLHAEQLDQLAQVAGHKPMSAFERAREELGFRRDLEKRLTCFEDTPDDLTPEREAATLAIFKAFSVARHLLLNRHDADTVAARFQDAVRDALQPRLF